MSGVLCSCDKEVDEWGECGVVRGEFPLHCISRRQCSARAISAASHSGSSGKMYFRAERSPSMMCCCGNELKSHKWQLSGKFVSPTSSATINTTVWVCVSPGHNLETCPDKPIKAQLTMTAASPSRPSAFCQVPMLATRCPKGLWWTWASLNASERISSKLLASAQRPARGNADENSTT